MTSHDADDSALQFDVARTTADAPGSTAGVTCSACGQPIPDHYFDANGHALCEPCRDQLARQLEVPGGAGVFLHALAFGLGGAVLGAVLYYAVIAITNFEIGIVAIAIGYMVGYAVRLATGQRGGRRFQVLALVLTYWSVGLAYVPFVLNAIPKTGASASTVNPFTALFGLVALSLALPVMAVFSTLPGGVLSAVIIGVGMHQAWRMTGLPPLVITGPYRVGTAAQGTPVDAPVNG